MITQRALLRALAIVVCGVLLTLGYRTVDSRSRPATAPGAISHATPAPSPDRPDTAHAAQPGSAAANPAGPTASTSPARSVATSTPSAASEVLSQRWPGASVHDERLEKLPDGRERWVQWLETSGPYPQIRTELTFATGADGRPRLVEETHVLADSVLIERPKNVAPAEFTARLQRLGFRTGPQYAFSPAVRVFVPSPLHLDSVPDALRLLATEAAGWQISPEHVAFAQVLPSDYNPRELWGLANIQAPAAWDASNGSNDVVVGVIDSGIDRHHPDLANNVWRNPLESGNGFDDDENGLVDDVYGWDFADNDNDSADQQGHGTHVAGIIGATGNNSVGVTGVNWRVKIIGLRTGNQSLATSAVIQALDYLTGLKNRGIPIIAVNNSYASTGSSTAQRDSIQRARDAGILFVASSGNDRLNIEAPGSQRYPVGYVMSNVVGVGATNIGDGLADYSNWGATFVHLAAPGSAILSTLPNSRYGILDGTSMAAPFVTGAAALLKAAEPSVTFSQIKTRLITQSRPIPALTGKTVSGATLDLQRLVNPTAGLPQVALSAPTAEIISLETATQTAAFTARGFLTVNGVEQSTLPLTWSVVEGGPATLTVNTTGPNDYIIGFPQAGLYRIAATATQAGRTATVHRTVIVGAAGPSTANFLGRWTFSEGSGAPQDSSGQARHGTLLDAPQYDSGPGSLAALRFSGTLTAVSFPAPAPSQITLSGWVHMDGQGNSTFPRILHFANYYLFLGRDPTAAASDGNVGTVKMLANWTTTDGVWHSPANRVGNGAWYHVAATYDSANGTRVLPRLYLDGREVPVAAQTAPEGNPDLATGTGYLGNNEERTRALLGRLADVRLYGRELAASEIGFIAKETFRQNLLAWQPTILSATPTTAVLGLRLDDGRVPGPSVGVVWQQITGPGAASFTATNGAQATLAFASPGTYTLLVDLTESGVLVRRKLSVVLPGIIDPPVAPGFVRPMPDRTVASNTNVTLEIEATGTPTLSYQWIKDGVDLNGQVNAKLILPAVRLADSGRYSVRVSNLAGAATSPEATLTVLDPPSITTQPAAQIVALASRVELSVQAAGSPTLTYQWRLNGAPVAGATAATYVLPSITKPQTGTYSVIVTNSVGSITSADAVIEALEPPVIISQTNSQTVVAGRTVTLDIRVGGTTPYVFQWYKNGQLLPGETDLTLRFTIVKVTDSGTYVFKITNAVGQASTIPIVLNVVEYPSIVIQPATQAKPVGQRIVLSVEARGTGPLLYQWYFNNVFIPGETGVDLVIDPLVAPKVGTYMVTVTNEVGWIRSDNAYVNIVSPPSVTRQPVAAAVAPGGEALLHVASDDPANTYSIRWWRNGELLTGPTTNQLALTNISADDVGVYIAEFVNAGGSSFSQPATISLTAAAKFSGAVATQPAWQDIQHPNGNVYDQYLLSGASGSISADAGQVSRLSFLDPHGDIVQVEISGPGSVTVMLAGASGPAEATLYRQPGILYMRGQATLLLSGAKENTHLGVYSVGPINNPAVTYPTVTYEGWATLRALGVRCDGNRVGGLRLGNVRFEANTGAVGLWAPDAQIQSVCYFSDISASGAAAPVLSVASISEVGLTGGSLAQPNNRAVNVVGVNKIRLLEGMSSTGQRVGPLTLSGRLERDGIDITSTIVVPPQ